LSNQPDKIVVRYAHTIYPYSFGDLHYFKIIMMPMIFKFYLPLLKTYVSHLQMGSHGSIQIA
ncbi:MAG: hypothetical protein KAI50_08950, partial [Desulfobacterales bacterium]|nr:hypothetical protein [Desulfobacterales bacterium]